MLSQYHALVAEKNFAHDGNIDKYIGDAALNSLGLLNPGQLDSGTALVTACAILNDVMTWNVKR
jgi:class 3 adenylate cyclase